MYRLGVEAGYAIALDMWRDKRANFVRGTDTTEYDPHLQEDRSILEDVEGREALCVNGSVS